MEISSWAWHYTLHTVGSGHCQRPRRFRSEVRFIEHEIKETWASKPKQIARQLAGCNGAPNPRASGHQNLPKVSRGRSRGESKARSIQCSGLIPLARTWEWFVEYFSLGPDTMCFVASQNYYFFVLLQIISNNVLCFVKWVRWRADELDFRWSQGLAL